MPKQGTVSKAVKKYVKEVLDNEVENKYGYFDTAKIAGASVTTTPFLDLLSGSVKGTSRENRLANKIKSKKIRIKGYLKAQTNTPTVVRMSLLRFKTVSSIAPQINEIYLDSTPTKMHYSEFNPNYEGEYFTVVWDKTFVLKIDGGGVNVPTPVMFDKTFYTNTIIDYNDSNLGTIIDIVRGPYYLCIVTDQAAIGSTPDIIYQVYEEFEDA